MSIVKSIRVGIMPLKRMRDYTLAIAKGTRERKQTEPAQLEQITERKASNLSRTLRTMANYGLVRLEEGSQGRGRRAVKPVAVARSVHLTLDIGLGDASAPGRVTRGRTEHIVA